MDEDKLKKILQNMDAPAPDDNARKAALNLANAAFTEKNQKNFKGNENTDRPMGITNNIWSSMMKNKFRLSGLSGAVAACAVLAVIGVPIFTYNALDSDAIGVSRVNNASGVTSIPGEGEVSPEFREAIKKADQDAVRMAEESAGSALPTPINTNEAKINLPRRAMRAESDDALAQWRQHSANIQTQREMQKSKVSNFAAPTAPVATQSADAMIAVSPPFMPEPMPPHEWKAEGQDEFTDYKDNSIKLVSEAPVSTFSIDVDTSSYSFMRRQINNGQLPQKDAVRVEELINYFDYDYTLPDSTEKPFEPNVAVYDSPWGEGHKLMHIGIKGYELPMDSKPRSNLVFLIDTSGSMNAQDKLPLLVNSFKMLLNTLDENDTIAIVTYAGSAGTVLEPTSAADKNKIMNALNNLRAGGSTAGAAGIEQAYNLAQNSFDKNGVNRVILATDGDFNVGITNHQELQDYVERKRDSGISLSVLGFGQGNYHDNLMQTLAQNGNGNAAYIDSLNEARKVLVEQAGSTLFTIAQDVKIQVEFNPALVSEYRLIGYETRHLNREDFNNDKIDAGEIGAGHAVTAIYDITPANSEHKMVDDLRYQDKTVDADTSVDLGEEYALLKLRYKLPQNGLADFSKESQLMTRPITIKDDVKMDNLSDDMRFAGAVAGFGQMLRGGQYLGDYNYDDVIEQAQNAKGDDEFGYRAEFINLVRLAKTLDQGGLE